MVEVSVVVPIYNVEAYLAKCVESLMNQTFKDMEVILVNDGSTDSSEKLCQMYASSYPNVSTLTKRNGGLSDARNFGTRAACGRYIAYVDADDYVERTFIETLYRNITKDRAEVAICGFFVTGDDGINTGSSTLPSQEVITGKQLVSRKIQDENGWNYVVAWNKLFDIKYLPDAPFEVGRYFEDEFSLISLYWERERISVTNQKLYHYVTRAGSIIKSNYSKKKMVDAIAYFHARINFLEGQDSNLAEACKYDFCAYLIYIGVNFSEIGIGDMQVLKREFDANSHGAMKYQRGSLKMKLEFCFARLSFLGLLAIKRRLKANSV